MSAVVLPAAPLPPGRDPAHYREDLKERRSQALARFAVRPNPATLLHDLARNVDRTLLQVWRSLPLPQSAALVAVGGYGRGELFPHSDVDILILTAEPPTPACQQVLEQMISLFWDIGLELGHSVRTPDECLAEAERDITVRTALLEARWLAGERGLAAELDRRLRASLDVRAFFRAKVLEMQQRHAKYQDTPYSLEPNCKESPGGLRDLQVILWITRAAGLGTSWTEMSERGLLMATEARQLRRNEAVLKLIRTRLHLVAGRREDRLVFDLQNALAENFGFAATPTRRASELLMQLYYWAAKMVTQLNTILLQNTELRLFPPATVEPVLLDERFQNVNGLLDMRREDLFESHPPALLEAFLLMQQHSELTGMTTRTLRAIWHGRRHIDAHFRRDPANRALFLSLFQQPRGIVHEFRRMNQLSVLGRYLPEFRRIVGQMQHDLFHVYTVDQHILMVMRNVRRFTMPEYAHEYPLCSRLIANFDRHWLLYVAALFHDIAKGRGGDHSVLGKVDARRFCRNHGLASEDTDLVVFLVEQHLSMSRIAQKEDLSDPDVIREFAGVVKTERHLTALYLLTVADVRGTSPKVWNAWKGKLLEDLFFSTRRALTGAPPSRRSELEHRQHEARRILSLYSFDDELRERFWKQLDVAWFLRHDAQEIAWVTRAFASRPEPPRPWVRARLSPLGEGLQVAVYTTDQDELLARICEFFETRRFTILDARVHTTTGDGKHYALDTFHVVDQGSGLHYRDLINQIETGLSAHIEKAAPLSEPLRGRVSRQSRNFPFKPTIDLRPDERGRYYFLNLATVDRAGLLYAILRVLASHRVNVQTAKITTLGDRVEDFFLVDGPSLSNTRLQIQLETELLEILSV